MTNLKLLDFTLKALSWSIIATVFLLTIILSKSNVFIALSFLPVFIINILAYFLFDAHCINLIAKEVIKRYFNKLKENKYNFSLN